MRRREGGGLLVEKYKGRCSNGDKLTTREQDKASERGRKRGREEERKRKRLREIK